MVSWDFEIHGPPLVGFWLMQDCGQLGMIPTTLGADGGGQERQ